MPLIPPDQNLFIIDLQYIVGFEEIDRELKRHIEFLDRHYAAGLFIASGPKLPRTGGIIIAMAKDLHTLMDALSSDPFYAKNFARYSVTEFRPSGWRHNLPPKPFGPDIS